MGAKVEAVSHDSGVTHNIRLLFGGHQWTLPAIYSRPPLAGHFLRLFDNCSGLLRESRDGWINRRSLNFDWSFAFARRYINACLLPQNLQALISIQPYRYQGENQNEHQRPSACPSPAIRAFDHSVHDFHFRPCSPDYACHKYSLLQRVGAAQAPEGFNRAIVERGAFLKRNSRTSLFTSMQTDSPPSTRLTAIRFDNGMTGKSYSNFRSLLCPLSHPMTARTAPFATVEIVTCFSNTLAGKVL